MQDDELQHLNSAFQIVTEAIDLAMKGKFPQGIEAVNTNLQVKGALELLSKFLKEHAQPLIEELDKKQEDTPEDTPEE